MVRGERLLRRRLRAILLLGRLWVEGEGLSRLREVAVLVEGPVLLEGVVGAWVDWVSDASLARETIEERGMGLLARPASPSMQAISDIPRALSRPDAFISHDGHHSIPGLQCCTSDNFTGSHLPLRMGFVVIP